MGFTVLLSFIKFSIKIIVQLLDSAVNFGKEKVVSSLLFW